MQRATIIVAGGSGKRMGGPVPKQFRLLNGRPLLCWSIEAFHQFDPAMPIIVVLPAAQIAIWKTLCIGHGFLVDHTVVEGGEERFHSVREGLRSVTGEGIVAVHDGVRPLTSRELIARCFAAAEEFGSAIPVVPISSSVREVGSGGSTAIDRSNLRTVQTPQCFSIATLRAAFELPYDASFTDEATLVERLGERVHLVDGEESNLKVTTPMDMNLAATILAGR